MVETAVAPASMPAGPRPRRWWRTLWVIAPVLFLVLLAVARIVYWRTSIAYQPLRVVGLAKPAAGHRAHVVARDGVLRSTAKAGHDQLFEVPLRNTGKHPLNITGLRVDDAAVVAVGWAANFVKDGHRVPSPTHALPTHVPAHATVNLQLMVRQPHCTPGTPRYLSAVAVIHWHAMISPHATKLDLLAGHSHRIALCAG